MEYAPHQGKLVDPQLKTSAQIEICGTIQITGRPARTALRADTDVGGGAAPVAAIAQRILTTDP